MKCKHCGTELTIDYPWWDCPNCKAHYKFVGLNPDGSFLMQEYKEAPCGPMIFNKLTSK